ncbi:hypothetical protein B4U80_12439, partial [Leptotrombidium deliense]
MTVTFNVHEFGLRLFARDVLFRIVPKMSAAESKEQNSPNLEWTDDDIPWQETRRKKAKVYGGKYLKGDLLGKGAYASVNEVLDVRNLQRKAVKRFNINLIASKAFGNNDMINAIFAEASLLKTLQHKNVLK